MRSMTHAAYIREKAREMRTARRLSIDQIAERLALPRTTIYHWVRDLPVPDEVTHSDKRKAARQRASRAMQRTYRLRREAAYREGEESFDELARDPTFRDFVALYIAEGYKRNRNCVSICNSDPAVVQLSTRWLRRLTTKPLKFSIQYHADQDLSELCRFWSDALDIEAGAIRLQRKSNSNQLQGRVWRSCHGVLDVSAGDTLLRARLQGWMDQLRRSWR
jgi:transcriptional regulator with XRE-family HTH domain